MADLPKFKSGLAGSLHRGRVSADRWLHARGLLPARRLTLPDFLCIGAQKSGTTWLARNLRRHPEVFVPKREVKYFDNPELWANWTLADYAEKFRPGAKRVKGDVTANYSSIPLERIRYIHRVMPDAKLIFLMRNPIDRAWSHVKFTYVKRAGRAFEDVSDREIRKHIRSIGRRRGDYPTILDNWLSVFPREQLFVGFFEQVIREPQPLLEEIYDFLGVSRDIDWSRMPLRVVANEGPRIPLPPEYREVLEELYCEDIERLYERYGAPVERWRCARCIQAAPAREAAAV